MTAAADTPLERAPSHPARALEALARRRRVVIAALGLVLVVVAVLAASIGAAPIAPTEVLAIALAPLGLSTDVGFTAVQEQVFWNIRAPRVVLAVLVGGALGASGVAMQGLLRNPLADAGLLGVSSGGALAAAVVIVLLGDRVGAAGGALGLAVLPLAAFGGGLAATLAVLHIGRRPGRSSATGMLLAGIGINALVASALGWLLAMADEAQLQTFTFWTMGSLGGARWEIVAASAPALVASTLGIVRAGRVLDVLALGERDARHLGLRVERTTMILAALVALGVGAGVAAAGPIGFVGLVVPHLLRMALGPGHRALAPASVIAGAALLVASDTVARTAAAPRELPLGVVTAAIGAPVFLALLLREPRRGGV